MCGLAGFLKTSTLSADDIRLDLPRMAGALQHRGPDDEGFWHDAAAGIALAHRRLSIIDLSALGHQPMTSAGGRFTIAYNGEIYNYRELRAQLIARGHAFRGGSDTEVLLAAVEVWGVAAALERAWGMFALALWDREERTLYLARDRFGEKPLYFGECGNVLLFGSELKAMRQHAAWRDEIDRNALALMIQRDSIPAPYSIFKNVRKVMPGSIVAVRVRDGAFSWEERRYWQPERIFEEGAQAQPELSPQESVDLIEATLHRAIERQMLADVPLGAFLSGGTDSSLVVAMMQKLASAPVKTFSIGFLEPQFDESIYARAVARHLGTEHTEYVVTPGDCLEVIPKLPRIYDEPFADPSQIPTYLVCRLARSKVTVALSGDGGDELFGGYGRYANALSKWARARRMPEALRTRGAALAEKLPAPLLAWAARPALPRHSRIKRDGSEWLRHHLRQWRASDQREFYHLGLMRWRAATLPVLGAKLREPPLSAVHPRGVDDLKQIMHLDTSDYLPNDILVKVDRAAMAVSLETRVPLLDVEVAQAAWRIPSAVLMHDGRGKWVLRQLLERYLPRHLVERPKKGFAVPIGEWLRGDLRAWAQALLDPGRLRRESFLDARIVQERWLQHLRGRADWSQQLWNVLMFQAWLEEWRGAPRSARRTYERERACM